MSRNHAALERTDLGWRVRDLDSSNGTFVNGIRVEQSAAVHPGDVIEVGHSRLRLLTDGGDDLVNPTNLAAQDSPGPGSPSARRRSCASSRLAARMPRSPTN